MVEKQGFPIRGPIQTDFDLSESHPVAGNKFTVSVRVENPFDVHIDILAVRILVPSGLKFLGKDRGLDIRKNNIDHKTVLGSDNISEELNISGEEPIELAPNDILIHNFHLQTEGWLFVSTKEYELNAAVSYIVDGRIHRQVIRIKFTTRTRVAAPIIGAVIGSLMGSFVKTISKEEILDTTSWSKIILQTIAATIFGIFATIIAVRRLGTQPVLTVEDIYGGFILGFFAGYMGRDFFETFYKVDTIIK